jgi:hypothetical protein
MNGVARATLPQEHSGPPAQVPPESLDVDTGQQPSNFGLPSAPAAPDLGHDPSVRKRRSLGQTLALNEGHDVALTPLHRQERPGIQHERHADT